MSKQVEHGARVTLHYILSDAAGDELDTNVGLGPLIVTIGDGQLLPGVEVGLAGMKAGDTKRIELPAKAAFGEVRESAFKTVPLIDLPEDYRAAGAVFGIPDEEGEMHQVKVDRIEGDHAVMDFNHPLAGMDVVFEVQVVAVE